jgi:uncharacterized tellurite resistance protein B-like protein
MNLLIIVKSWFSAPVVVVEEVPIETDTALSVAAVLLELALSDDDLDANEQHKVVHLLAHYLGCTVVEAKILLEQAYAHTTSPAALAQHLAQLQALPSADRTKLLEMLWQVVYADGHVDDYELYFMRRVCASMHLSDADCQAARLKAVQQGRL